MARIGVLGAGSWGTALALLLHENGHQVTLWSALPAERNQLETEKTLPDKLPGVRIPDSLMITGELALACSDTALIVMAVASPYIRKTALAAKPYIAAGTPVVCVAKGIEEATLLTLTQVLSEELPQAAAAVLSGPSHAEEVSKGIPTTCVAGAADKKTAELIQDLFMNERFRVYISPDMTGIELGGSLKNVIALAAGIADGLGFGDNTKAALMTRGIAEISRLGMAMGGRLETFAGLSGIGDLMVTCTSKHSRNRKAGFLIGSGYTVQEAMQEVNQVVEGVYCAKAALSLAKSYCIEMPIVEQVNQILFDGKSPAEAVSDLLLRDKTIEYDVLGWDEG